MKDVKIFNITDNQRQSFYDFYNDIERKENVDIVRC